MLLNDRRVTNTSKYRTEVRKEGSEKIRASDCNRKDVHNSYMISSLVRGRVPCHCFEVRFLKTFMKLNFSLDCIFSLKAKYMWSNEFRSGIRDIDLHVRVLVQIDHKV